ncbi:MAG: phosphatidylserine/phosphatidylglycerophosphate/cardiolipin synthase family protein [Victivallaceae bacterium]
MIIKFLLKRLVTVLCFFGIAVVGEASHINDVYICRDSQETLERLLPILAEAVSSIEISFCFAGGKPFRKIMEIISHRLEVVDCLKVKLMAWCIFLDENEQNLLNNLKTSYPERFDYLYVNTIPSRFPDMNCYQNHQKFFVIDEKYFCLGGTNFEELMCSRGTEPLTDFAPFREHMIINDRSLGARDQDIMGRGSLAVEIRKEFYRQWGLWQTFEVNREHCDSMCPSDYVHISLFDPVLAACNVYDWDKVSNDIAHLNSETGEATCLFSGPHNKGDNPITQAYIELIDKAEKEIIIGNLYFMLEKCLKEALVKKASQGVCIKIVTNGCHDKAPGIVGFFGWGNRFNYLPIMLGYSYFNIWDFGYSKKLSEKNVSIYEYHVDRVEYHKKILVVDRKSIIIGSYNLGRRSHLYDYEVVFKAESSKLANFLIKIMEEDIALSKKVTREEAESWQFNFGYHFLGTSQNSLQS